MTAHRRRSEVLATAVAVLAAGTLALLTVLAAYSAPGSATGYAPIHKLGHGTSTNWSGYVAHPGTFTQASATWTQPAVTCASGETSYASFWTGIDGDGSGTVEQTGTDADCQGGTPKYYAWYEMYPKFPSNLGQPVVPGDAMSASVAATGKGAFTLTISDATQGWTFTIAQRLGRAQLVSAEVIAEAPSSRSGVLPLADFGSVSFSASMANAQPIGTFQPEALTMVTADGTVKAAPTSLSGGTSFQVDWKHS